MSARTFRDVDEDAVCPAWRPQSLLMALAVCLLAQGGCTNGEVGGQMYMGPERLSQGLVVILPGIEGEGVGSFGVRTGLLAGGVKAALPVFRWGRPIPLAGPLLNQTDVHGNRLAGQRIARMVVNYQDAHPGRPVYLVGHSGGGGVAVFAAEAMPPGRSLEGLILLSASLSSGYDLSDALAHCRKGIVNFHSKGDVAFLMIGTTLVGNVDGVRGPSAGAIGFERKYPRLYQVPWSPEMAAAGNFGGHADTTHAPFVSKFVAPWILADTWPVRMKK